MLSEIYSRIPLNDTSFFVIKKGNWSNSIDIIIKNYFDFNIFNLFMIFKSYIYEEDVYIYSLNIVISNADNFFFTHKRLDINLIKKLDFNSFVIYIENLFYDDREYLKLYKYVGFRICMSKYSKIFKKGTLYPIYPWNLEIKEKILEKSNFSENYTNKLKFYEEKENIEQNYMNTIENYKRKEEISQNKIAKLEDEILFLKQQIKKK